ncbi:endonuclease/exonuclease/phosphatase family protein [Paenibacillus xerothermodurans]|uniref:Endonuclease/exonuclease/phosphatase domain-containing protein n=1 Tax=Paenibacillus xerothermodurans TaxID=1977292 RepID=A0A2W1NCP6_PAEXE|nr:endonuclease/exonuclease/phosphatase family protein [Paenibacillus xerothermodurans]PZE20831.1 hypothetical protein CBW46_011805 [Paenibacillus xerothermodurans]
MQLNVSTGFPVMGPGLGESVLLVLIVALIAASLFLTYRRSAAAESSASHISGSAPAGKHTFMTFNIRHAKGMDLQVRLDAIRDQIGREGADFVALQEVDRYQWRSGLHDQARYLANKLDMHYSFAPALKQGFSEYGVALLSRYPMHDVHTYPLPGEKEQRVLLTARTNIDGRPVTLATTHLGVSADERALQMPILHEILRSIGTPLVLMGDFNMSADDPLMQESLAFLHKVPLVEPGKTLHSGGEIDHIWTSFPNDDSARAVWTRASDHLPVVYAKSFSEAA